MITDESGAYAAIVAEFTVVTDKTPAAYDVKERKLTVAEGSSAEDFSAYLKSISKVKVGKTTKITAKVTSSGKITYKSSNSKIATVSSKGVVKGKKKGIAKITVTCNGVKKVFTVTVK